MSGIVASRDERVFTFSVGFDVDSSGRPLEAGIGSIRRWREIDPDEIEHTEAGVPNSWLHAVIVAREVFERELAESD